MAAGFPIWPPIYEKDVSLVRFKAPKLVAHACVVISACRIHL